MLRIEAQIAMLKRALLAAEDEGLPHKAICEYLHTLSQMAKLEPSAAPDGSDPEHDEEAKDQGPSRLDDIQERLRQAITDIYGISDLPTGRSVVLPNTERTADK